jgi:AraC-like DNA-binding protein
MSAAPTATSTGITANNRLAELLLPLAVADGKHSSVLDAVQIMRGTKSSPRAPVIYDPSIVIIAQGRKQGYVGGHSFTYDANNYLVMSIPLPFECETTATVESPLLGISIKVEPSIVAELLLELDDRTEASDDVLRGFTATPLSAELLDATERLLKTLNNAAEARILGPQIIREVIYRILCSEQGDSLKALVTRRSKFSHIAKTLRRIHSDFADKLDVETLAEEANMSISAFHHNFKVVTSIAPLQYIKSVRLHKARILMVQEDLNANVAASRVGYESASQFSREFKRLFGSSPAEEAARMRAGGH